MQRLYDYKFKIVLLGSSSVGKSAILKRFADDQFEDYYLSTIGVDFRFKSLMIEDKYIKIELWDTAGQQRFKSIVKTYYNNAHAIILIYDIKNPKSLQDIKRYWLDQVKINKKDNCQIYIFANKCDDPSKFSLSQHQYQFFTKQQIPFYIVSAKTGFNITSSMFEIIKYLMQINPILEKQKLQMTIKDKYQIPYPQKKKGCCS